MAKKRQRIRLVCWHDARSTELESELAEAGFWVDDSAIDNTALKALAKAPPEAVVIDLGRLPAQGRDIGIAVRTRASTRNVPLVFVDGAAEKVAKARQQLPDAVYTTRSKMASATAEAIANPPADPVVPSSNLAGYSGTPLPKKLGINTSTTVALVDAPDDFSSTLVELPPGVSLVAGVDTDAQVTLWFIRSLSDLTSGIDKMAATSGEGRLWICWPKKASGIATDVTQNEVRSRGLATGIVDFKICAIDATWSGLCFTRRKK